MKKLIYILFIPFIFNFCGPSKEEIDKQKHQKLSKILEIDPVISKEINGIIIQKIRACDYLILKSSTGVSIVHCGDCPNSRHLNQ